MLVIFCSNNTARKLWLNLVFEYSSSCALGCHMQYQCGINTAVVSLENQIFKLSLVISVGLLKNQITIIKKNNIEKVNSFYSIINIILLLLWKQVLNFMLHLKSLFSVFYSYWDLFLRHSNYFLLA